MTENKPLYILSDVQISSRSPQELFKRTRKTLNGYNGNPQSYWAISGPDETVSNKSWISRKSGISLQIIKKKNGKRVQHVKGRWDIIHGKVELTSGNCKQQVNFLHLLGGIWVLVNGQASWHTEEGHWREEDDQFWNENGFRSRINIERRSELWRVGMRETTQKAVEK